MVALVCAIVAIVAAPLLYAAGVERARAARALSARRAAWGKPRGDAREMDSVLRHHALGGNARTGELDEGTWRDLGMDAVFAHLDRAETFAGRARLHERLRAPTTDLPSLRRFDDVVTLFEREPAARERVQSVLVSGDSDGQDGILEAMFSRVPAPSPMRHAYPVVAGLTVASIAAIPISPVAGLIAVTLAACSIGLRVAHGRRMLAWLASLRATRGLLDVASRLVALRVAGLEPELETLRVARRELGALARATSWLTVDTVRGSELLVALVTYVNAFLLVDLAALARCFDALGRHRDALHRLFAAVGDLDAALAVASFRAGAGGCSRPEIDPEATALQIDDAVHPLLDGAVPNSLHLQRRGLLITGPNMSGKSTFVRTIAINAVLAQTVYTTLSRRYLAPLLCVRTLMNAVDDVQQGRSYYLAEVACAKALLQPSEPGTRALVIVDELFRGTNTSERIGAGKAVLSALCKMGHMVLASTHDRELVALLRDDFEPAHFGEHVRDGQLVFPFTLCAGPSTTRNAIVLLQQAAFPPEVIAEAVLVTEAFERADRPS
jgi:hypothetical protein